MNQLISFAVIRALYKASKDANVFGNNIGYPITIFPTQNLICIIYDPSVFQVLKGFILGSFDMIVPNMFTNEVM